MFWSGDKRQNRPANEADQVKTENKSNVSDKMSREELLAQSPEAREMYEKIKSLRSSVDSIKVSPGQIQPKTENPETKEEKSSPNAKRSNGETNSRAKSSGNAASTKATKEARRAAKRQKEQEALKEAQKKALELKQIEEAEKRAKLKAYHAKLLREEAQEATEAAKNVRTTEQPKTADHIIEQQRNTMDLSKEEIQQTAEEQAAAKVREAQKKAKIERERRRQQVRDQLSQSRGKRGAKKQAEAQRDTSTTSQVQQGTKSQREAVRAAQREAQKIAQKKARAEAAAKQKAEKHAKAIEAARLKKAKAEREAAAKRARELEEAKIKEARKEKARQLWRERDEKRQAERRKKLELKQQAAAEDKQIHEEIKKYRLKKKAMDEKALLQKMSEKEAALGGGIVTIHDTTIQTEVNKRQDISLIDLLGIKTKAERKAATAEERKALRLEREFRREDARYKYSFNRLIDRRTYESSALAKFYRKIENYSKAHRRRLVTIAAALMTIFAVCAGGVSYCTAYEYSYNGTVLGYVNNKNDVLTVTNLVEEALSDENNVNVIIQPQNIKFKRVSSLGGVEIDNTEKVLKRLTYMGNYKVASYGIYVDGQKIGAVKNKKQAANVLENLKNEYTTKAEKAQVQDAVFLENVKVKQCSTRLQNVRSTKDMLNILTSDTNKETVHKSIAGETVKSIATEFGTTTKRILKDNSSLSEGKLAAGTPVVIKTTAPPVTVKITEKVSYTEKIKYDTEKTEDKTMYKGDEKVTQKGKNGSRDITAKITTVNGKKISQKNLVTSVTSEPVTKKITVGTKKRPPTVGDGKFSNPIHDTYHTTTGFEMRWGSFHKGLDIACPTGTKVHAADGGTVITASYKPSYGNLVVIDHKNGYTTKYAHNSKILVHVGQKVYEGEVISLVGSTGNSTGPHCHFEVRYNDVPKNPRNYIKVK